MSYKCPFCNEIIDDPEIDICPSCHWAFNEEFGFENIDPDTKIFNTEEL